MVQNKRDLSYNTELSRLYILGSPLTDYAKAYLDGLEIEDLEY